MPKRLLRNELNQPKIRRIKMKKYITLSFLFLTACGVDTDKINDQIDAQSAQNGGIVRQADTKEIVVEYRKEGQRVALSVADTADLPGCSNANVSQLVYVKSANMYFECANETWTQFIAEPVKTPEEQKAPSKAIETKTEIKAEELPINGWKDPISGSTWLIGGIMDADNLKARPACSNEYRLPRADELLAAYSHGLIGVAKAFGDYQGFWTGFAKVRPYGDTHIRAIMQEAFDLEANEILDTMTAPFGVACIKP